MSLLEWFTYSLLDQDILIRRVKLMLKYSSSQPHPRLAWEQGYSSRSDIYV